jgi:tellurite resistance protein TehA-like permease
MLNPRDSFWVVLALIAYVRDGRRTYFNLTMWSAAYPVAMFGVACTQIAKDLDSPAFEGIASAILIIAVIHWLWLVIYTVPMIISGELFLSEAEHLKKQEQEAMEGKEGDGERSQSESSSNQVERRSARPRASDETRV